MFNRDPKNNSPQYEKNLPSESTAAGEDGIRGLGKSLSITGNVKAKEDLFIDGKVRGSVTTEGYSLTIGPNGNIEADLKAKNIFIRGQVRGNIRASEKVSIQDGAQISGDIAAADISIADNARFEGDAHIRRPKQDSEPE